MDEIKTKELINNQGRSSKYHQASYVYLLNAVVYFFIFTFRMPPHDFGILNYLFYTLGIVFIIIFPYLIYKEYRIFTAILAIIYFIRTVVSLIAIPFYSKLMVFMFILHAFTCLMLVRAAWNIKIFNTIQSPVRNEDKMTGVFQKE